MPSPFKKGECRPFPWRQSNLHAHRLPDRTSRKRPCLPRKSMPPKLPSGNLSHRKLYTNLALFGVAAAGLLVGAVTLHAQDAGALVEKLVKKGILSDQEGAEVRTDMQKD